MSLSIHRQPRRTSNDQTTELCN